jgi:hypothetical protein
VASIEFSGVPKVFPRALAHRRAALLVFDPQAGLALR